MSILSLVSNGDVQRSFRACIQSSGQVQSWLTKVPVRSKNIKFGPKWIENRRFGPKQSPNESHEPSGPIRTSPAAKNPGQLETQCSIWTGWPDGCSVLAGWSFPIAVSGWGAHCYPSGFPVHLAKISRNLDKISQNHQKSTC